MRNVKHVREQQRPLIKNHRRHHTNSCGCGPHTLFSQISLHTTPTCQFLLFLSSRITMGCRSSKLQQFAGVDDSIHVMMCHAPSEGGKPTYVPRPPHPLLFMTTDKPSSLTICETDAESETFDSVLLYHHQALHQHNDTVDSQEVVNTKSTQQQQDSEKVQSSS